MSRDFAWHRLHDSLTELPGSGDPPGQRDLRPAFNLLWEHMRTLWATFPAGLAVQDAACATLCRHRIGHGTFRLADYDLLLAPWRSVIEHDPRSRLALTIAHQHPHEIDDHWWAVIDTVLAPERRMQDPDPHAH